MTRVAVGRVKNILDAATNIKGGRLWNSQPDLDKDMQHISFVLLQRLDSQTNGGFEGWEAKKQKNRSMT